MISSFEEGWKDKGKNNTVEYWSLLQENVLKSAQFNVLATLYLLHLIVKQIALNINSIHSHHKALI